MGTQTSVRRSQVILGSEPTSQPSKTYTTLSTLANSTGFTVSHLRRLCNQGKIDAVKVGNLWLAPVDSVADSAPKKSNGGKSKVGKR